MTREKTDEPAATVFLWPIDVLRFVFALLVACGHAYGSLRWDRPDVYSRFFDRVETGGLWVAGFFVLSGYCIVAGSGQPTNFDFTRYMAARLSRILPLYLVFLVAVIVAEQAFDFFGGRRPEPWTIQPWTLLAQFTMTQGLFGSYGSFNPSWSLTHEILCYAAWGGLVVAVGHRLRGIVVLGLTLLPLVAAVIYHSMVHDQTSWRLLTLPLYFFIWLLGAAVAESRRAFADRRLRRRLQIAAVPLTVLFVAYSCNCRYPDTIGMIAFSALLSILLFHLPKLPAPGPRLEALSRRLGLASYPLYLGHGILLAAITVAPDPAVAVPRTLAAMALVVLLSLTAGVWLEEKTLEWRSGWLKRTFARTTRPAPEGARLPA